MSIHGNFDFRKVTIYLVGGTVRDYFIGSIEPKDKDYVVVGSSPEEMLSLGFKKVGADFPVFLHPDSGDEYALARTERKSSSGYNGFDCQWEGVTIEEDLSRRDLTINSIAWDCSRDLGKVVDPFNGRQDIKDKILRPTTSAFKEDPLRLLRVARFLSRHHDFKIHEDVLKYGIEMEHSGELDCLTPERVWLETEKALKEKKPSCYFEYLSNFNLPFMEPFYYMESTVEGNKWHQEDNVFVHTMMVLDHASENWSDSEINFACLLHDIAKPVCYAERSNGHGHDAEGVSMIEDYCKRFKVPNNYRDIAKITCEQHQKVHGVFGRDANKMSKPKSIMKMFEQSGALSKPERFKKVLKACESDHFGRIGEASHLSYNQRPYLEECLDAVISLDTKDISSKLLEQGKSGVVIGQQIREARIHEIRKVQRKWKIKLEEKYDEM